MKTNNIERGEHPAFTSFRRLKTTAEAAVDRTIALHPEATEAQKQQLAFDLNWTLLQIRFGVGGDPKAVWGDFKKSVRRFPNTPKS